MAVENPPPPGERERPPLRVVQPRERRALPHNSDLEASILGGIIMRNEVLADLPDLEIDDFYDLKHKVVFEAMRNLQHGARPIDVVMLEHEVERVGKLDAIGGVAFLGELALHCPTADNVCAYRDEVRTLSRNRRLILELSSATERAQSWPHDPSELLSELVGQLQRLEDLSKPPPKRLNLISIEQSLTDLDQLAKAPVYPTPFPALNEAIGFGGLLGTQVYTVAASTGRGKTTWVAHVAAHTAEQGIPVLVASYEMKPGYFVARKAAGVIGTHSNEIIRGAVSRDRVLAAMPYERFWLMHNPSLADLRDAVKYLAQKYGVAPLLVVDYIQKLADQIALGQQRPDLRVATSQASSTLCDIADRTGAAVIAVSAIGRGKGKILAAPRKLEPFELVEVAKESGAVEYDGAGMIVLALSSDFEGDARIATMTAAKCRFGEECHIDARYNGKRGEWWSLERVNVVPKATTPPDDGAIAAAITRVLQTYGPQRSKTQLHKLTGRNKTAVISEVDAMLTRGAMVLWNGMLALPEHVQKETVTAPQGTLAALIKEAVPEADR